MIRRKFLIFSLNIVLITVNGWKRAIAESKKTKLKIVKEYFLLMPEKYIKLSVEERKTILQSAVIEQNDEYLSFEYGDKKIQIKLYKKRNNRIILVLYLLGEKTCETVMQEIYFLEPNADWKNITKECLSDRLFGRNDITYNLPVDRSTITVYSLGGSLWFELESTDNGFVAVSAIE